MSWLAPLVAVIALALSSCGGDSNDNDATTTTGAVSSAAADATAGTVDGTPGSESTAGSESAGSAAADGSPATGATTPSPEPTDVPTQDPERVKQFTNGILGEAQQPLFYLQLITGNIECGTGCGDTIPRRWDAAIKVCGAGRWEARKSEDGYSEPVHGPLIAALVESCNVIGAKYSAGGTPDDSDEWREVANSALNILGPQYDVLLESTVPGQ